MRVPCSPDMMMASPLDAVYIVTKSTDSLTSSQLTKSVTDTERYRAIAEVMGTSGLLAIHRKVVFIEGTNTSLDIEMFEQFFPPSEWNVNFVPSGPSSNVNAVADKIANLLETPSGFHEYYCIIDGDSTPSITSPAKGDRLFRLPVYHIENYLLDPDRIFAIAKTILGRRCPFTSASGVEDILLELVRSDDHVSALARSGLNDKVQEVARAARSAILAQTSTPSFPSYAAIEDEMRLSVEASTKNGAWRNLCKGRDILRGFAGKIGIKYELLRNLLISSMPSAPEDLSTIMAAIGASKIAVYPIPSTRRPDVNAQDVGQLMAAQGFLSSPPDPRQPRRSLEDGTVHVPGGRIALGENQFFIDILDPALRQTVQQRLEEFLSSYEGTDIWNALAVATPQTDPHYDQRLAEFCQRLGLSE